MRRSEALRKKLQNLDKEIEEVVRVFEKVEVSLKQLLLDFILEKAQIEVVAEEGGKWLPALLCLTSHGLYELTKNPFFKEASEAAKDVAESEPRVALDREGRVGSPAEVFGKTFTIQELRQLIEIAKRLSLSKPNADIPHLLKEAHCLALKPSRKLRPVKVNKRQIPR